MVIIQTDSMISNLIFYHEPLQVSGVKFYC